MEAFSCLYFLRSANWMPAGRPTKSWTLLCSVFASSLTTICTLLPTDSLPFSTDDLSFDRIIWLSSRSPHYQKNFPNGSYLAQKNITTPGPTIFTTSNISQVSLHKTIDHRYQLYLIAKIASISYTTVFYTRSSRLGLLYLCFIPTIPRFLTSYFAS